MKLGWGTWGGQTRIVRYVTDSGSFFNPKYRLAQHGNYLFSLPNKLFSGSKYPENKLFDFENKSTGHRHKQSFCLSQNIRQVTPEIIYFQ